MANEIILANGKRLHTRETTEDNQIRHYQRIITEQAGSVATPLLQLMATSAPSVEMAADFSATAGTFLIQPAASAIVRITGLTLLIQSVGAAALGSFGDIAAIAAGLTLKHLDDTGDILDLLDGQTIKTNEDLAHHAELSFPFSTLMVARFRFPGVLRVEGTDDGERLALAVNDDLSGLTRMRAVAEGFTETTRT